MVLPSIQVLDSRKLLRQKILEICSQKQLSDDQIESILNSYSESWRHYHNCNHILKMLNIFERCEKSSLTTIEQLAIQCMIVWHDVFYKLNQIAGWNESNSVDEAENDLERAGYEVEFISLVCDGIFATSHHTLMTVRPENQAVVSLFLDIDLLAGLGTSWEESCKITQLIQSEYQPLYTAAEFQAGRKHWAKGFLDRPKIFLSPHFAQYETMARENLKRYIDED